MSVHIGATEGDIAETVLLPGDPLRAKFAAENFLEGATRYSEVRGMYGYTGTYKGKRVSIQGTGMGIPSALIYVHELITAYGVKKLIRIGSAGSIQPNLAVRDLVFAMAASTDSGVNIRRFGGASYAPTADFELFQQAVEAAKRKGAKVTAGNVLSTDEFYHDAPDYWKIWAEYGVQALEMETAALYTTAAKFGCRALTMLTISDSLVTGEELSAKERETSFREMIEIALEVA
ncbi:MAG: purine-nucleoside phosphorylase [Spirochaetaceae bacterium]